MSIAFNAERWARVKDAHRKWWAGELDRPLITVTLSGYESDRPKPELPWRPFTSHYGLETAPEAIVDAWDYELSTRRFMGDGFPQIWPNFGPGVAAAFLGCDLVNGDNTSWFVPRETKPPGRLTIAPDDSAPWFKRIDSICRAAQARWEGLVQVSMTDLGGNLDIVSSFLPGEKLLLALYDEPDEVERLLWEAHHAWWHYFEALNRALQPANPGYSAWAPLFSETPYYMLQCDFCYMIGPEMFDRFVKPELAATCQRLDNPFYHLDGPGQLPHLDSLLTIPELKGVQWIPGAGRPGTEQWPDVYRRIHAAGKRIQLYNNQSPRGLDILDVLAKQIGDLRGVYFVVNLDREAEPLARELLLKYGCPLDAPVPA